MRRPPPCVHSSVPRRRLRLPFSLQAERRILLPGPPTPRTTIPLRSPFRQPSTFTSAGMTRSLALDRRTRHLLELMVNIKWEGSGPGHHTVLEFLQTP